MLLLRDAICTYLFIIFFDKGGERERDTESSIHSDAIKFLNFLLLFITYAGTEC